MGPLLDRGSTPLISTINQQNAVRELSNGIFWRFDTRVWQAIIGRIGGEFMAKNYEEVAMDVIREDWEYRKNLNVNFGKTVIN